MTDFETHPAGTIARLEAYMARRRKSSQTDYEDIHGYDAGCATEAVLLASDIEAMIAAITRANAATAAAFEVAAKALDSVAKQWSCGHPSMHCDCARDIEQWEFAAAEVRALATPDQTAALDRLIAEAEARVWEKAAGIAGSLLIRATVIPDTPTEATYSGFVDDAILAASKKGGA